mmetsp:Transcript_11413/g.28866  ORF Transcript_11413/g.28866 Transcript_11413/m.28866 type:complete len:675 (+) Transcript_11413:108-2132(+)
MDAEWLKENVGDSLTDALVKLAKTQPDDPIDFLGKQLIALVDAQERVEQEAKSAAEARRYYAERAEETRLAEEAAASAAATEVAGTQATSGSGMANVEQATSVLGEPCEATFDEDKHGAAGAIGVAGELAEMERKKIDLTLQVVHDLTAAQAVYMANANEDGSLTFFSAIGDGPAAATLPKPDEDAAEDDTKLPVPFKVLRAPDEPETGEEEAPEGEAGDTAEGDAAPRKDPLPRFEHVPNVLAGPPVPFFNRVPMLGSFLAVHVPYKKYIHRAAIPEDGGLIVEPQGAPAEDGEEGEGGDAAAELADEGTENACDNVDEEVADGASEPKKKVWRAETIEASYILCMDTIGCSDFNTNGISDADIEKVRQVCLALSRSLTETEAARYQAEMQHRDWLARLNATDFEAQPGRAEQVQTAVEEQMSHYEAVLEAIKSSAEAAAAESEEPADGAGVSAEEEAFKRAEVLHSAFVQGLLRIRAEDGETRPEEWWKTTVRAVLKQCIPPTQVEEKALNLLARIYGVDVSVGCPWETLAAIDLDDFASKVLSFTPCDPAIENIIAPTFSADAVASLTEEFEELLGVPELAGIKSLKNEVQAHEELAAAISNEQAPVWLTSLVSVTKYALAAVSSAAAFRAYLDEEQRKKEEAEAAAAAAAAEAEAEAEAEAAAAAAEAEE